MLVGGRGVNEESRVPVGGRVGGARSCRQVWAAPGYPHCRSSCTALLLPRLRFLCRQADLQRLDILINGEAVDALARVAHRDKAQAVGRRLVAKLRVGGWVGLARVGVGVRGRVGGCGQGQAASTDAG